MSRASRLELTANISVIVSAIMLSVFLVHNWNSQQRALEAQRPYKPGDHISTIKGLTNDHSSATLLLVLRSTCRFCNESVPFYRRLLDQVSHAQVKSVALMFDRQDIGVAYIAKVGLQVHQVLPVTNDSFASRVSGTPTLILLDKSGVVVNSWVGKISADAEQDVIRVVKAAG
jgi:hypothetical protein